MFVSNLISSIIMFVNININYLKVQITNNVYTYEILTGITTSSCTWHIHLNEIILINRELKIFFWLIIIIIIFSISKTRIIVNVFFWNFFNFLLDNVSLTVQWKRMCTSHKNGNLYSSTFLRSLKLKVTVM